MYALGKCKYPPQLPSLPSRVLSLMSASTCRHVRPPSDTEGPTELDVVNVTCDGEWTSVTFARWGLGNDASVSVRWGRTVVWHALAAVTCQLSTSHADRVPFFSFSKHGTKQKPLFFMGIFVPGTWYTSCVLCSGVCFVVFISKYCSACDGRRRLTARRR